MPAANDSGALGSGTARTMKLLKALAELSPESTKLFRTLIDWAIGVLGSEGPGKPSEVVGIGSNSPIDDVSENGSESNSITGEPSNSAAKNG
jgi:hypothetical protein